MRQSNSIVERFILVAAALTLFAGAGLSPREAVAAPPKETAKKPAESNGIELSAVIAPVQQNGKLTNYIFMTLRVQAAKGSNEVVMQERMHIMRDALVRAMHAKPIVQTGPGRFDMKPVTAQLQAALTPQVAGGKVASVTILTHEAFKRS